MSLQLEFSTEVDRPVEEVFEYVTTPENDEEWKPLVVDAPPTEEPMDVGTTWRLEVKFIVGTAELVNECTVYEPPSRFGYRNEGSVATDAVYTFTEAGNGTLATWAGTTEFRGVMRLLEPFAGRMLRNEIKSSLEELKSTLERKGADRHDQDLTA